jgi:hypothetical protein
MQKVPETQLEKAKKLADGDEGSQITGLRKPM